MGPESRLTGWKEIASYLDVSVRTAKRWRDEHDMPVHASTPAPGSRVFALPTELDVWLDTNGSKTERNSRNRSGAAWASKGSVFAVVAACLVLVWVGWALRGRLESQPDAVITPGRLSDLDGTVLAADYLSLSEGWSADAGAAIGKIAFHAGDEGEQDIFLMDDNGENVVRLTDDPGSDHSPAISPDGSTIAFSSDREGLGAIYAMDIDGTNVRRLSPLVPSPYHHAEGVHWHPDGTMLVTSFQIDGTMQLFSLRSDGSDFTQLTNTPTSNVDPRYSLDGERIYVTSSGREDGRSARIAVYPAGGQREELLDFDSRSAEEILVDGVPCIFFVRTITKGIQHLYRLTPHGLADSEALRLTQSPLIRSRDFAVVRPRGPRGPGSQRRRNQMLFVSDVAGAGTMNIWRVHTDGSNPVRLTQQGGTSPDWWVPREQ